MPGILSACDVFLFVDFFSLSLSSSYPRAPSAIYPSTYFYLFLKFFFHFIYYFSFSVTGGVINTLWAFPTNFVCKLEKWVASAIDERIKRARKRKRENERKREKNRKVGSGDNLLRQIPTILNVVSALLSIAFDQLPKLSAQNL